MSRAWLASLILLGLVVAAVAVWTTARPPLVPPADSGQEAVHRTPDTAGHETHDVKPASEPDANTVTIPADRLQAIGVTFQKAEVRTMERLIRTVGRVEVDERRLARVNLKFEGWIEDLRVSAVGDHVKKDAILFTIYSPDLVATQEEYLLALQSVRQFGASEFPEVARGAKDLLEATRRRFELWDVPDYHIRELEHTGKVLRTLPVHAPLTGTVIRMQARAGTYVTPGTELYLIADLSRLWILADIYEYELPYIKVGQGATVTLSYDPTFRQHAHVGFIYPTLDPKTRTAKVRFELENLGERLKPDMYANVELAVPLGRRLAVPRDAVLETGQRRLIFIHHGSGTLEWRNVTLGVQADDWVEVLQGVREGEHIVTSANFLIDSESRLKSAVEGMAGMPGMK
ncbi:efflux RND transporter periplasmic adaptor subunit [Candidatus Nitrospira bockiana]